MATKTTINNSSKNFKTKTINSEKAQNTTAKTKRNSIHFKNFYTIKLSF
ncbi:MAG: hypothetical protein RR436_06750 [Clostridia bacterium]